MQPSKNTSDNVPLFSRRPIVTLIIGTVFAVVLGLVAVNTFMYLQYSGTMFDRFFQKKEAKSPAAGKLAFSKGTAYYIGVIRSEGHSSRQGDVYYIEQPGGSLIEVAKTNVDVRDAAKSDK